MKPPYRSMYGQMVYVLLSGLQLLFIPNVLLGLFGLGEAHEIWIQILGLLVLVLTIYYYNIAKYGNEQLVMATVYGRLIFCAGLVMFVILGKAQLPLIGFAILETGLALWSWKEVKG